MTPKATVLKKCPSCGWTFEVEKGDKLHPHCSTKKPKDTDITEDVVTKLYDCRNPKCLKPITVYYYRAKPFFRVV